MLHEEILVVACGLWFLEQRLNLDPLHWEHAILATGSPVKSPSLELSHAECGEEGDPSSSSGVLGSDQNGGMPGNLQRVSFKLSLSHNSGRPQVEEHP